jgi:hypothetical protein
MYMQVNCVAKDVNVMAGGTAAAVLCNVDARNGTIEHMMWVCKLIHVQLHKCAISRLTNVSSR